MKSKFLKGKKLSVTSKNGIRFKVDQLLQSQYKHLKGKNTLRPSSVNGFFTCGTKASNDMIMDYIRDIYDEYHIKDPLKNKPASSQGSSQKEILQTPKKVPIHSQTQISTVHKRGLSVNTNTQPNSNRVCTQINSHHPSFSRQIVNNPRRSISFIATNPPLRNKIAQQTVSRIQLNPQSNLTIKNNVESERIERRGSEKVEKRDAQIQQRYRYCIGCQDAVLTGNMKHHEGRCGQYQKIYRMELEEILNHLQEKIDRKRERARKNSLVIGEKDCGRMRMLTQNMCGQSQQVKKSGRMSCGFVDSYNEAMEIGRKWSETSEQINKLRWFLKIREEIKRRFDC